MSDLKQPDVPSVTPDVRPITRAAIGADQLEKDADEMAAQAKKSEETFDDDHEIFDKL